MPHPIYGPPSHSLDSVRLLLTLPTPRNGHLTIVTMHGDSETKRGSLWSYSEQWTPEEAVRGLTPADSARHVLLACLQDRCSSQRHLEDSLKGDLWDQPQMF